MSKHIGSSFDDFLEEDGYLAEAEAIAAKRVISYAIEQYMEENSLSKTAMAKEIGTSRTELNRILDPENISITLSSIVRAVDAVGKKLKLKLVA